MCEGGREGGRKRVRQNNEGGMLTLRVREGERREKGD